MKKTNGKKLALKLETLASLSPDMLDGVHGGQAQTTQLTRTITRYLCPKVSQLICPPSIGRACAGGAGQGGE